ncbi:substrate-binding periplasmic protein [Chitinilyticum piscinae]|uniref:Transporter substrate-binding domain-containing protein n=1 Tax=Chitinilyticum piscinae TaxID=2866724 RepID=A0A8J7FJT3_9NEIS|nr:transporter substrate-binding domain-containing protein [Chitinilyticum piscinae]MBE9608877.1 transporter substrate-binding domain-containing protein [Chitinilyticum piscinae]
MRKCLLSILFALLPWQPATAIDTITLYGDANYPPYSYLEDGQFKGIYVDFLRQLAAELPGYQLELKPVPWKRGLAQLQSGEIFGLFPPYRLSGRDYIVGYSEPLFRETVVLLCHRQYLSRPRQRFPDDFTGLVIGVNSGFLLSDQLQQASHSGQIRLEEAQSTSANLRKLASARIACYANDRLAIRFALQKLRSESLPAELRDEQLLVEVTELASNPAHIGFGRQAETPAGLRFRQALDAALRAAGARGDIRKLLPHYGM